MNAENDEDDDTYDFFVVREREEGEIWSADESMEEVQVPEEQVGQADEEEVGEIAVSSLTSSIVQSIFLGGFLWKVAFFRWKWRKNF